jgi:excisionase family DNA binding protein
MTDSNHADRLWTADEVAAFVGLHVQTVYAKANAGEIASIKIGNRRRFRRRDVEAWIEAQAGEPATVEGEGA